MNSSSSSSSSSLYSSSSVISEIVEKKIGNQKKDNVESEEDATNDHNNTNNPSARSVQRAKSALVDYLRDVKGPKGKRSLGHLFYHFCNEDINLNHKKFDRLTLVKAVEECIRKNELIYQRKQGVVGSHNNKNMDIWYRCNEMDWLVYNPYPKAAKIEELEKLDFSEISHGKGKPYPCIDNQCLYQGMEPKWSGRKQTKDKNDESEEDEDKNADKDEDEKDEKENDNKNNNKKD